MSWLQGYLRKYGEEMGRRQALVMDTIVMYRWPGSQVAFEQQVHTWAEGQGLPFMQALARCREQVAAGNPWPWENST